MYTRHILLSLFTVFSYIYAQETIPTILQNQEEGSKRFIWRTEPGVQYTLEESPDLEDWSTVGGFPREAEGPADFYDFNIGTGKRFFRATLVDEQPPVIVNRLPVEDAIGVPRFSDVLVRLEDTHEIDESSIRLSIAGGDPIGLGNGSLTFEDNVIRYDTVDTALAPAGETVNFTLNVSDELGNAATYTWEATIAVDPVLMVDEDQIFVFGSPAAQRAGQQLSGAHRNLSRALHGAVRLPANTQSTFELTEIRSDSLILTLTGTASPVFNVNDIVCNNLPLTAQEIFYRRITSIQSSGTTLTLVTQEIDDLTEIISDGDIPISEQSRLINPDGSTSTFQRNVNFDFELSDIGLGVSLFEDDELLGIEISNPNDPSDTAASISVREFDIDLDPIISSCANIRSNNITQMCTELGADIGFTFELGLDVETTLLDFKREVFDRRLIGAQLYLGNIGIFPVFGEIALHAVLDFEADLNAGMELSMRWEKRERFSLEYCYPDADEDIRPEESTRSNPSLIELTPDAGLSLGASAKVSLKPQLRFTIYRLAGIGASIFPFAEASAEGSTNGGLEVGAKWGLGYEIKPEGLLLDLLGIDDLQRLTVSGTIYESPFFNPDEGEIDEFEVNSFIRSDVTSVFSTPSLGNDIPSYLFYGNVPIPGTLNTGLLNLPTREYTQPISVVGSFDLDGDNEVISEPAVVEHIAISPHSRSVSSSSGTYEIEVVANELWSASTDANWITLTENEQSITVVYTENTTTSERQAMITVGQQLHTVTQLGREPEVPVNNDSLPAGFVTIPEGNFVMGDTFGEGGSHETDASGNPVTVFVSEFAMQTTEVTNAQMAEVMNWALSQGLITASTTTVQNTEGSGQELLNMNGGYIELSYNGSQILVDAGMENYPIQEVSWYGAVAYASYKSRMEGRGNCYDIGGTWDCDFTVSGYRLPTEAEWEKAARGGQSGNRYPWGNDIDNTRANYNFNVGSTTAVASYPAGKNGYGLYDMAGNVYEWCNDWSDSGYYGSDSSDPQGASTGFYRVVRGGSWGNYAINTRVSGRNGRLPTNVLHYLGFRLALVQ